MGDQSTGSDHGGAEKVSAEPPNGENNFAIADEDGWVGTNLTATLSDEGMYRHEAESETAAEWGWRGQLTSSSEWAVQLYQLDR